MEAPKKGSFLGKIECLALWPRYLGEKRRTLGKTYGIKSRYYWNTLDGNPLGT